jgi:hypothetical protein
MARSISTRRQTTTTAAATGASLTGPKAVGARILGPSAMGPLAIAVSAIGALAIGRLAIANAVIRKPACRGDRDRLTQSAGARSRRPALARSPANVNAGIVPPLPHACAGLGVLDPE